MTKASEFSGRDTPSGVLAHTQGQLTASDKLRLGYMTGQIDDPDAPVSRRSWEGLDESPNSVIDE